MPPQGSVKTEVVWPANYKYVKYIINDITYIITSHDI